MRETFRGEAWDRLARERFVSDRQEVPEVNCKDLLRGDIAEIGTVMSEIRAEYGSLRAMEAATGLPKSTVQYVTKKAEKYKKTGLLDKTLNVLKRLADDGTTQGRKLKAALDKYEARKRAGLYGHVD